MNRALQHRIASIEAALHGDVDVAERAEQIATYLQDGTEPADREARRRAHAAREAFALLGNGRATGMFTLQDDKMGQLFRVASDEEMAPAVPAR